ncbi:unnamed protein product [Schistosoma margrebowiei]|uniref:Uncharacterized protein n=1 Tax=Schistosoma margrebowiei TaxID=48269 RepID=A0A3P8HT23_9TREM|nr:unnamed protein product [Schistosoma margrebowiei]
MNAISMSKPTNSVRCRCVLESSARKTEPMVKTLSKSAAMAICLYS